MSNSFLDEVDHVIYTGEEVGDLAASKVEEAVTTFDQIRRELKERNAKDSMGLIPPSYEEILTDDAYWDEIQFIYDIISRYKEAGYESAMSEIDEDLAHLSAGIVRLSMLVGYSKGVSSTAEADRKLIHAKLHIQIREIAEELGIKMTDSAAEKMSRTESHRRQLAASYALTAFEVLQGLYYAASAFVRVLEGIAQRGHHEKLSKYT